MAQTLRELLEEHPEYADLPVAIYRSDGTYHYINRSGSVYIHKDRIKTPDEPEGPVLVFSPN